ncbi:hypothetical protein [Massilia sp. TSP1-1-2]|uniref:hypothetical protein n=1 Tax=Massilia sp. TSP1-1-2 TaxID=2804649 RepID=UPI003CFB7B1B
MALRRFGAAINFAAVRIFNRRYLPFGLQPKNGVMTANGAIYFHRSCCLRSFSAGSEHARYGFLLAPLDR